METSLRLPPSSVSPDFSGPLVQTNASNTRYAKSVPDMRQTLEGIPAVLEIDRSYRSQGWRPEITIFHPVLGPSAVTTENALMARALMSPAFVHDSAASRMARVSTAENGLAPRIGSILNVWA